MKTGKVLTSCIDKQKTFGFLFDYGQTDKNQIKSGTSRMLERTEQILIAKRDKRFKQKYKQLS